MLPLPSKVVLLTQQEKLSPSSLKSPFVSYDSQTKVLSLPHSSPTSSYINTASLYLKCFNTLSQVKNTMVPFLITVTVSRQKHPKEEVYINSQFVGLSTSLRGGKA